MQMTKELTVFKFNEQVIRRVPGANGKIYYCVNDICAAMGVVNVANVIKRLQCKDVDNIYDPAERVCFKNTPISKVSNRSGLPDSKGAVNNAPLSDKEIDNIYPLSNTDTGNNGVDSGGITWIDSQTAGGVQRMAYTDEVGLYDIIGKSRKPLAKVLFRKLIEAVPAMRQEIAVTEVVPTHNLDLASIKSLAQEIVNLFVDFKEMRTDVVSLKNDVSQLKTIQEVKASLPPVPPLTRRNEIILFIDKFMAKHPGEFYDFEDIWNHLYDVFRLRTKRDIKREARASKFRSVLAYVQYVEEIDRLWVVARDLFNK